MIHSGAPIKIGSKAAAGIKKGMPVSIKDVSGVDTLVSYTSTDNKFVGVALEDNYEFDSMVEGSNAPTVPSVVTNGCYVQAIAGEPLAAGDLVYPIENVGFKKAVATQIPQGIVLKGAKTANDYAIILLTITNDKVS